VSENPSTEKPPVSRLIEMQRRLAESKNPFLRRIGVLWAAGVLDKYLTQLTDRQVGQLMFDHVGRDLGIAQPEATICSQATQRLFRSRSGSLEGEFPLRRPCPECRNEMLFHYGIDESDYFECVYRGCGYRDFIGCGETQHE
jgi:hypothetical protein